MAASIEVGSAAGGSALWFADALRSNGIAGGVLSIDLEPPSAVSDDRVTFLAGDAQRLGDVLTDDVMADLPRPLLVIEEAAHTFACTAAVLSFFPAPAVRRVYCNRGRHR